MLLLLQEEDDNFYTYSQLLTASQLKVITAVSKNGTVDKPYANEFIQKYGLPAPSTVRGCLEQLIDKDFIIEERGVYSAYNRFYMLWLRSRR
jgi:predicted transcriptional regulator